MQIYIDADPLHYVGQVGFLVRYHHVMEGWEDVALTDLPARGNIDRQPRLRGWCGTTNDVATRALGVGRIVKILPKGRRCLIEEVRGEALLEALLELGYPELAETEGR